MAMNDRINNPNEDIEALMPWYEKGTLPDRDAKAVANYVENHPESERFLELIREEVTETIEANESLGVPSGAALNRLMDAIAAEPNARRAAVRERASGFLAGLFGQGASPWLAMGAAAACLVILVQAAALGVLMMRSGPTGGPNGIDLASGDGPRAVQAGSFALVRFAPTATASDISELLRSLNAVIVDGPKPGGVYRVKVSTQTITSDRLDEILKQMRARSDIIAFVSVSG
jgi:anti-sigma factor RsiW